MNRTILVPIDFSNNSNLALQYACEMASQYGYAIHVIHAFQPLVSKFADDSFNREMTENAEAESLAQLNALKTTTQAKYPNLEITVDSHEGEVSDVLMQVGGKASHQLIIMGTQGANAIKDKLMGTNTYNAIMKAPLPVFAIPDNAQTFTLKNAGLLTNFKKTDLDILQSFTSIFDRSVPITLLHIRETNSAQEELELYQWRDYLQDQLKVEQMECMMDTISKRLDVNDSIPESIHDMAEEAGLDALLVTYNNKSFFKKIFSRNLVKNIAHQIHRPVFFFKP